MCVCVYVYSIYIYIYVYTVYTIVFLLADAQLSCVIPPAVHFVLLSKDILIYLFYFVLLKSVWFEAFPPFFPPVSHRFRQQLVSNNTRPPLHLFFFHFYSTFFSSLLVFFSSFSPNPHRACSCLFRRGAVKDSLSLSAAQDRRAREGEKKQNKSSDMAPEASGCIPAAAAVCAMHAPPPPSSSCPADGYILQTLSEARGHPG